MKIDISAISLDVENFRHVQAGTEPEAIRFLLSDEKTHKVYELAADIVEQGGLDPSSLLIVTEDQSNKGRYIALEGNRRITALKTLMTPHLSSGMLTHQKFKALNPGFLALGIRSVECVVLDRSAAAVWIKRKHYKGMGGAGVLQWNAVATARSDAKEGIHSRWMTSLAYLETHNVDAEGIRDSIGSKTTTVERVLSSPHIFNVLGLTFGKDGTLVPENGDEIAAVNLIQSLLETMSDRTFVETVVSNASQQLAFINRFLSLNVRKPPPQNTTGSASPTTTNASASSGPTGGGTSSTGLGNPSQNTASPASRTAAPRSKPATTRKVLAEAGLRISNQPLNKFYGELRRLNIEKNPYVSFAVIRIFLEKSSTVFLESMHIPPLNPTAPTGWHDYSVKLKSKVGAVLKNIDPTSSNNKLIYARDVANGNRDKTHTIDHLNGAIHSHHALPAHTEIVTIWDRYHPYFVELFETIEKQNQP